MVDDPRRALRSRRLAVHPGPRRPARQDHRRLILLAELHMLDLPVFAQATPDLGGGACAQMLIGDANLDQTALTRESHQLGSEELGWKMAPDALAKLLG